MNIQIGHDAALVESEKRVLAAQISILLVTIGASPKSAAVMHSDLTVVVVRGSV